MTHSSALAPTPGIPLCTQGWPLTQPHPCWERTRGLGSLLANDAFLGTEKWQCDPSAWPRCSHLFWKRK